ncbi:MAG: UDP-N-acetylmuramate dehydrogenase [Planctomycetes bacterium]|nr:UDP-N-acetylmuramate dehydrogenase [Planctomycetota bacterium]
MSSLDEFKDILEKNKPLAPLTWLKVGGTAEYFAEPRTQDELIRLVQRCQEEEIPLRVMGSGSNLLVRDEGVRGVVVRLTAEEFCRVSVNKETAQAGCGALLSQLIAETVREGLAGLETLVGIPGTVGGALRGNAGGRTGDIGQFVKSVLVLTATGEVCTRSDDELDFGYRYSSITDPVILEGTFELSPDDPDKITRRLKKQWIVKKSSQPLSSQSAGCIFKNPRGVSAGALIEDAGLVGKRVGGAEVSDRHANFIITHEGATADDVLKLCELIQDEVSRQFGVELEYEIQIW